MWGNILLQIWKNIYCKKESNKFFPRDLLYRERDLGYLPGIERFLKGGWAHRGGLGGAAPALRLQGAIGRLLETQLPHFLLNLLIDQGFRPRGGSCGHTIAAWPVGPGCSPLPARGAGDEPAGADWMHFVSQL